MVGMCITCEWEQTKWGPTPKNIVTIKLKVVNGVLFFLEFNTKLVLSNIHTSLVEKRGNQPQIVSAPYKMKDALVQHEIYSSAQLHIAAAVGGFLQGTKVKSAGLSTHKTEAAVVTF